MTAHDPSLPRKPAKGLMGWLERGLGMGDEEEDAPEGAYPAPQAGLPDSPRRAARRQMLQDITAFLMAHDLEVNTFTLSLAHDHLAGNDRHLTRAIEQRLAQRQPLTQPWLEGAAQGDAKDQGETLNRLMLRMEADLEAFSATTTTAQVTAHWVGEKGLRWESRFDSNCRWHRLHFMS